MGSWTTPRLDPDERAFVRQYRGDECLYRDACGRRVLADFEGSGWWKTKGDAAVSPVVDGVETANDSGNFAQSLRLVTEGPEDASVVVWTGSALEEDGEWFDAPFEGNGWIRASEGDLYVDGEADAVQPRAPVPFFQGFTGFGRAKVVRGKGVWRPLAMEIKASGASHPHPVNGCRSVLNQLSLMVQVPEQGAPLRLIRTYDRFHGRQRALVFANGEVVGWWRDSIEDRERRISTSAFGFFAPEGPLTIRILPQPGTALWSFGVMQALVWQEA